MQERQQLPTEGAAISAWHPDAIARARRAEQRAQSPFATVLFALYRFRSLRNLIMRFCFRLEGGPMFSATWRKILLFHHGVSVGKYSYGSILTPGVLPVGTMLGAYCSVGTGLIVRRRNHPVERPIQHPFFYNARLGMLSRDTIMSDEENPLTVGNDVWIGDRVTILGGCRKIGNGAVIGAGAVVTHDVPPYAITGGVPARFIRMRFEQDRIKLIEASRWWEKHLSALIQDPPFDTVFTSPDIWNEGH